MSDIKIASHLNEALIAPCGSVYMHTKYVHGSKDNRTDILYQCEQCDKYHVLRMRDHKGHICLEWLC